ncbi:MAG: cbb3-type cytochrome c oxidase subunit I [Dehalococcoidia bacterium]|nr:cbb3-type cytochrome c oxidase subunit I [Dehalococcoidia bacterium]
MFTGMAYLMVGVGLGLYMAIDESARILGPVHAHANLVGFVTFNIFGIGYHILPRFRGRPLYSEGLAWVQFWAANIGLAGFLVFTATRIYWGVGSNQRAVFAALMALSFVLFVYNMGRTMIQVPPQQK